MWTIDAPPDCTWCDGPGLFKKSKTSTGFRITAWCVGCAKPATPLRLFYPKGQFSQSDMESMGWLENDERARCPVCKRIDFLEVHHLAPRAQFGTECDLWPTVEVCRDCHERWHAKMGQPIAAEEVAAEE